MIAISSAWRRLVSRLPDDRVAIDQRTVDLIRDALGPNAPDHSPVRALVNRELSVDASALEVVMGTRVVAKLIAAGMVLNRDDRLEPLVRIDRVGALLVASDLRRRRWASDYVVGPGPASFLLARYVRPPGRGRVLDLGAGCGIQALLLADRGRDVLGLDVNPRALAIARLNAVLNRRRIDFEHGDFLNEDRDGALDGRFQTVVANPPFVLAPTATLVYRDRTLPGDLVTRRTIERVAQALAPGGRGYVLGNWISTDATSADDWAAPVREWLADVDLRAVAVRIASQAPEGYAAVWTRTLPAVERTAATATWAAALSAEGVERIEIGVVALGRPPRGWIARGSRELVALDRTHGEVAPQAVEAALAI